PVAGRGGKGAGRRFAHARHAGLVEPGCELAQGVAVEVVLEQWYPVIAHGTILPGSTVQATDHSRCALAGRPSPCRCTWAVTALVAARQALPLSRRHKRRVPTVSRCDRSSPEAGTYPLTTRTLAPVESTSASAGSSVLRFASGTLAPAASLSRPVAPSESDRNYRPAARS